MATVSAVAFFAIACGGKLSETDRSIQSVPLQTVDDMFAVQSKNGSIIMRMEAEKMEHYENDTITWDLFPDGFAVYTYTEEGLLETLIMSDKARHVMGKNRNRKEIWEAFGNVVVHNVIKQETMESDTMYWDREKKEIYTDCYVKMFSPTGFMQGRGMRSDDRAKNAILMNPFNSYGVTDRDTTTVVIDSVNFIGPFPKR